MDGPLLGAPRSTSHPCIGRYFSSGTCFAVPHRTKPYRIPCHPPPPPPPELGTPVDPTTTTGEERLFAVGQPDGNGPFINNLWAMPDLDGRGGQRTACALGGFNLNVVGRNYTSCSSCTACKVVYTGLTGVRAKKVCAVPRPMASAL